MRLALCIKVFQLYILMFTGMIDSIPFIFGFINKLVDILRLERTGV